MGKKRTSNPHLLNNQGVKRMWEAAIKQAVEDLDGGVIKSHPNESKITKQRRALEAYHWLMTERSDAAFESQDVYSDEIRAVIRKKLQDGSIRIDLNASLKVRRPRHNSLTTT